MIFYIFHRHRVCLVDHVDLICSLYSWWEGFGSSSLATLPLGFNCGFVSTSACGSSTGVCSWCCPGGLGFAPVRARCGGGNKTTIENPKAVWLNLPTSCTCCRLNQHDQLSRLCIYGIYKRSLGAPTKESTLVLIAVDIRGKNTEEEDQIRIWADLTAGPKISTVLEGILGRWGGLWLPAWERTVTAVTQEKHLLFLCFDLLCRFFWIFFFSPSIVVVDFIGAMKSN